jgi:hypothetical protein
MPHRNVRVGSQPRRRRIASLTAVVSAAVGVVAGIALLSAAAYGTPPNSRPTATMRTPEPPPPSRPATADPRPTGPASRPPGTPAPHQPTARPTVGRSAPNHGGPPPNDLPSRMQPVPTGRPGRATVTAPAPGAVLSATRTSTTTGWESAQGRGPDPGSQPRIGPLPSVAASTSTDGFQPDAQTWANLASREVGGKMFLAGFGVLVLSIVGLMAIGITRRRW